MRKTIKQKAVWKYTQTNKKNHKQKQNTKWRIVVLCHRKVVGFKGHALCSFPQKRRSTPAERTQGGKSPVNNTLTLHSTLQVISMGKYIKH